MSPAESRLPAIPLAPLSTSPPKLAIAATAVCTAMPTITQMAIHAATTMSLINCARSRAGVVA